MYTSGTKGMILTPYLEKKKKTRIEVCAKTGQ